MCLLLYFPFFLVSLHAHTNLTSNAFGFRLVAFPFCCASVGSWIPRGSTSVGPWKLLPWGSFLDTFSLLKSYALFCALIFLYDGVLYQVEEVQFCTLRTACMHVLMHIRMGTRVTTNSQFRGAMLETESAWLAIVYGILPYSAHSWH